MSSMTERAQYTAFDSELDQLLTFNKPLSMNVPAARWQRKQNEAQPPSTTATPKKKRMHSQVAITNMGTSDRFIPNRRSMNMVESRFRFTSELGEGGSSSNDHSLEDNTNGAVPPASPAKEMYRKNMEETLGASTGGKDQVGQGSRILSFRNKAPVVASSYQNNLRVLYSQNKIGQATSSKKVTRHIPQSADRVLDAPDLIDSFYLNILDWNQQNILAVALGASVYLWNATSGAIQLLMQCESPQNYISSLRWIAQGNYLAVGCGDADVQLWDVEKQSQVRSMQGHQGRVGALSWNQHILSSGSATGHIFNHDVRQRDHHVATLEGHTQEVCGLKWSPNGERLASGGNDNLLQIFDAGNERPRHTMIDHTAAVRALDWCPWQADLLVSGGGTADRHLRFWNTNSGALLNQIDTKAQVCSVLWNKEHRELVSAHGIDNKLNVWKYPTLKKVGELTGHKSSVLHLAASPDGQTVVSASGDETLRFWPIFGTEGKKKKAKPSASSSNLSLKGMIR